MNKNQGLMILALSLMVFISGCENNSNPSSSLVTSKVATDYTIEANQQAWLRKHLPTSTVAYLNVPTPWNYLFDAKADALHAVQSLPAHQAMTAAIKQGAEDNYFKLIPSEYQGLTSLVAKHMQTSLEVAVINDSPTAMLPTVVVGTQLSQISPDELAEILNDQLHKAVPGMALDEQSAPSNDVSLWSFKAGQFPAYVQYAENNGRLLIYGGMGANVEKLSKLWQPPKNTELSSIQVLSQKADPSGLNLKAWIAPAKLFQLGGAFIPPEQREKMVQYGVDQMDYVWLGTESANGHAALAMHIMMPDVGWRLMLPKAADWFDVELAGQPRSVLQFSLPTDVQIQQAIKHFKLAEKLSPKDQEELKVLTEFKAMFGFDIYDFFRAYHQQIYWVSDESGSWLAMKVKDQAMHDAMETKLNAFFDINPEEKTLAGQKVWQAHFSSVQKLLESAEQPSADADQVSEILNLFKDHLYWYEEDGVFYLASVPQILATKRNTNNPQMLSTWLQEQQGGNWDSAIMAYGKSVNKLPQDLYHFYLLVLQGLGDMAQVEVDLFSLPTASELNLPDTGRVNLVLSSDVDQVSLRVGYEYSMVEGVFSSEGGFAAVAVVAILAAYAIPAYRDYSVRQKVGEQLSFAAGYKSVLSEQWQATGSFAGVKQQFDLPGSVFDIDDESGLITIDLSETDAAFEAGDFIYLEPEVLEEGSIRWQCWSTIKASYLPTQCR